MMIQLMVEQCGNSVMLFDNADIAIGFLQTLAKVITPEMFIDLVHKLVASSDAVAGAKAALDACMGQGA